MYKEALGLLDRLRAGELIFDVPAVIEAGRPENVVLSANVTLLSSITRIFGDLTVDPKNPSGSQNTPFFP
jgi:hypothetical protein